MSLQCPTTDAILTSLGASSSIVERPCCGGCRLAMLALAFLTVAALTEHAQPPPDGLIPLTRNEIAWPPP